MMLRLYIGIRRFSGRKGWITIDDIFRLNGAEEILLANKGAKNLLDDTRQTIAWKLSQENRTFVGNIWEGEIEDKKLQKQDVPAAVRVDD